MNDYESACHFAVDDKKSSYLALWDNIDQEADVTIMQEKKTFSKVLDQLYMHYRVITEFRIVID